MAIVCRAQVLTARRINENVIDYVLKPNKYIPYEAGQFLQLTLDNVTASDFWPESRTFSIASYKPEEETIRLIIKRAGLYTSKIIDEVQVGSEVTIKYAFGEFVLPIDNISKIIYLASGIGITPFLSFVNTLERNNYLDRISLLYSVKRKQDVIDYDVLVNKLSKDQLKIFTTQEKNIDTINRRIQLNDIIDFNANYKDSHYYICGSSEFVKFYKQLLVNHSISHINVDDWE